MYSVKSKISLLGGLLLLLFAACGANEPSVGEKEAAIYREYAEQVMAAKSIEDIAQLQNEGGYEARIAELAPEWRALIKGADSSAYYAERSKVQPVEDSLKRITEAKLMEFIKNQTFK